MRVLLLVPWRIVHCADGLVDEFLAATEQVRVSPSVVKPKRLLVPVLAPGRSALGSLLERWLQFRLEWDALHDLVAMSQAVVKVGLLTVQEAALVA